FDAVKNAYKDRTDYTAINNLDEKSLSLQEEESKYTEEEKYLIDSINNAIISGSRKSFSETVNERSKKATDKLKNQSDAQKVKPSGAVAASEKRGRQVSDGELREEKELRLWKQQMLM